MADLTREQILRLQEFSRSRNNLKTRIIDWTIGVVIVLASFAIVFFFDTGLQAVFDLEIGDTSFVSSMLLVWLIGSSLYLRHKYTYRNYL
jgi:hypothetical protein